MIENRDFLPYDEVVKLEDIQTHHLNLMKKFITRYEFDENFPNFSPIPKNSRKWEIASIVNRKFSKKFQIVRTAEPVNLESRFLGRDWPMTAESMIGMSRMNQLHDALDQIRLKNVEGDIVETGIWRGGAVIFISTYLTIYGMTDRIIYGCDSFEGLPTPEEKYPEDRGDTHSTIEILAVSKEEVENNFKKYNLSTSNIKLVKGWFEDTLPKLPVEKIAILRLDGDMYSSTIVALNSLFPKVAKGGIVIVDDFSLHGARKALYDYFELHSYSYEVIDIDGTGAYFVK